MLPLASGVAKADVEFARRCKMKKGHGSAPTVDLSISTGSTTIDTNATPNRRCFRFCFRFEKFGAQKNFALEKAKLWKLPR
jgi:hypothetical protein